MKGKPIEPGCLAMIVGYRGFLAPNNGRVVKVGRKVMPGTTGPNGLPIRTRHAHSWEVLSEGPPLVALTSWDRKIQTQRTCVAPPHLIRIDDNDENLDRVVEQSKPVIKTKPIEEIF